MIYLKILNSTSGSPLWKARRLLPVVLAVFLVLFTTEQGRCQSQGQKVEAPDAELLEFLGAFEDTESGWVDPFELEDIAALSSLSAQTKQLPLRPMEEKDASAKGDSDEIE